MRAGAQAIRAVIVDLDGTMLDTARLSRRDQPHARRIGPG
jgi:phosphoglycolate phosphatase-like HAD superfamily hydrolase